MMYKQRLHITVNDETLQIWPRDEWTKFEIFRILGNNQIGFDYISSELGFAALKFRNTHDFKRVLSILEEKHGVDTKY